MSTLLKSLLPFFLGRTVLGRYVYALNEGGMTIASLWLETWSATRSAHARGGGGHHHIIVDKISQRQILHKFA
eukprot:7110024-Ditylum_brightwellii.AAC.1